MNRVLVTGLGVVSPAGISLGDFWDTLLYTRDCFTVFSDPLPCTKKPCIGGIVPSEMLSEISAAIPDDIRTTLKEDRNGTFLTYCVLQALQDANIAPGSEVLSDTPLVFASLEPSILGMATSDKNEAIGLFDSPYRIAHTTAAAVGCQHSATAIHNTCASGNAALEFAVNMLTTGIATSAIVCGADAASERIFAGFDTLGAVGIERCRPFSKNRKNITISEGAVAMVIQLEKNVSEPSEAYAEIVTIESNNDASHPTNPSTDGIRKCHLKILESDDIPRTPDVVFAHGTGSRANDAVEAAIFLDYYPDAHILAIKGTVGHAMGSAALIGAVASCLTIRHQVLPPNAIERAELEYPLKYFPTEPQPLRHDVPLLIQNNSFGFGGSNSISVFGALSHG